MKWLALLLIPTIVAAPLDDALDWLGAQDVNRITIEAGAAAGMDIRAWPDAPSWGHLNVPLQHNVRALHAAALTGYDPMTFASMGGDVDVVALLEANHAAILAEDRSATIAFHVLAMHAAGFPHDGPHIVAAARQLAAHAQGGAFPCNQFDLNPDCTGFAVAALSAVGKALDCAAVGQYWSDRYEAGAYGNTNNQAWAIVSLEACGQPVPDEARAWLLAQQQPDGSFGYEPGAPGHASTRLLATADAVLALAEFPGPAYAPIRIDAPALAAPGERVVARALGDFDSFSWQDGSSGTTYTFTASTDTELRVHGTGPGVHGRAATVVNVATTESSPLPAVLPVIALLAMLRLRAPWAPR